MKTLIVVSHPDIEESPTQQFLKAAASTVPGVTWHEVGTNVAPKATERALLAAADRIVLQFPLYWYQAPPGLTSWLNAVWPSHGLAGKSLGLVVNTGQPQSAYTLGGSVGVSLDALLAPYVALAHQAQLTLLSPFLIAQFMYLSEAKRMALLVRYQQYLTLAEPQRFKAQAQWWQTNLAKYPTAALVQEALAARQERLEQLQATLTEMKGEA